MGEFHSMLKLGDGVLSIFEHINISFNPYTRWMWQHIVLIFYDQSCYFENRINILYIEFTWGGDF